MISIKPRTAEVIIYQGDDLARIAELRQAAEVAERKAEAAAKGPRRGGDGVPSAEAEKAAFDEFVTEAADRAVIVELRALGRKRFAELMGEHPPRKVPVELTDEDGARRSSEETHPADRSFEVDTRTFGDALLSFVEGDVATIVQPEFPTKEARREFLDNDLAEGDFETLWVTAYQLNRNLSADPKSAMYGTASPRSTAN